MIERNRHVEQPNPVLILAIENGAGHIRVAQGLAAAIHSTQPSLPVMVVDIADYMTRLMRFTHVTSYLWLVKHAPAAWGLIDKYQKKQTHTSPEWYYRKGSNRLFKLARGVRPRALIATEVGCCEVAALIKRDLGLRVPLIAINNDLDADHAWVQPEVDLYSFVTDALGEELISHGAPRERVVGWGAPLSLGFDVARDREKENEDVCLWLDLNPRLPLVLIAGGGEGMGRIEEITKLLLDLQQPAPQLVVLTGHNQRAKLRCEQLGRNGASKRLRVLGWTGPELMPKLMSAADLMVSKLGSTFYEAMASELPIIALPPPPGSERVQHRLLDEWNVGRGVRTLEELVETVERLLSQPSELSAMREQARARCQRFVSQRIARWLAETLGGQNPDLIDPDREATLYALYANTEQYRNVSTGYKSSASSLCDS